MNRILMLRLALDMSRGEFARICGVDVRTLSRWENDTSIPTGAALEVIKGIEAARAKHGELVVKNALKPESTIGLAYVVIRYIDGMVK